jgi:hypothetical protein
MESENCWRHRSVMILTITVEELDKLSRSDRPQTQIPSAFQGGIVLSCDTEALATDSLGLPNFLSRD